MVPVVRVHFNAGASEGSTGGPPPLRCGRHRARQGPRGRDGGRPRRDGGREIRGRKNPRYDGDVGGDRDARARGRHLPSAPRAAVPTTSTQVSASSSSAACRRAEDNARFSSASLARASQFLDLQRGASRPFLLDLRFPFHGFCFNYHFTISGERAAAFSVERHRGGVAGTSSSR